MPTARSIYTPSPQRRASDHRKVPGDSQTLTPTVRGPGQVLQPRAPPLRARRFALPTHRSTVPRRRAGSAGDGSRSGEGAADPAAAPQSPARMLPILATMRQLPPEVLRIGRQRPAVPRKGHNSGDGAVTSEEAGPECATALHRRAGLLRLRSTRDRRRATRLQGRAMRSFASRSSPGSLDAMPASRGSVGRRRDFPQIPCLEIAACGNYISRETPQPHREPGPAPQEDP